MPYRSWVCASRLVVRVLAMVLVVGPAALADRPDGMDTSSWDEDITPGQWAQVYNAGYVFAFIRATRGVSFTDSELHDNMERAPQAGLLAGCYHVVFPEDNTAEDEADYFVSVAGDYITGGYLRPVLDLERGSGLSKAALSNWVNNWLDRVEQLTGVEPIIYTNTNYATYELDSSVADRDLWIAAYWATPDPENGEPDIGVFNDWAFWQWTAHCIIPGIPGSADCDVFNGTMEELQDYVIPGGSIPAPFIVESRSGGKNYSNYSETGTWGNNNSYKSSAPGCTSGIGHRWCTIDSSAKTAVFSYTPDTSGTYEIFTTNCTTWNSGEPLIHKVTHTSGTTNVGVCQNADCDPPLSVNVWRSLGEYILNASTQYSVTLDGSTGAGSSPANNAGRSDAIKWVFVSSGGPTITQHPIDHEECPGDTVIFTVSATGQGMLSYQWQKDQVNLSNGGHYSGVTTASLTVSNVDSNDVGDYRCVVTDDNSSTNSNTAALSLKAATAITLHPSNQNVSEGETTTFTVSATGEGSLTYQWQKGTSNLSNGGRISGATSTTLQIADVISSDAGDYHCVVTGGCGSANSNYATLSVSLQGQPGDFDGDGDVDLADFASFQACLSGDGASQNDPSCAPAKLDPGDDVDGDDLIIFLDCLSGASIAGNPNCAD